MQAGELAVVGHQPTVRPDVAGALPVSPSTASRLCDRLVSKGLITREAKELDRKAMRVAVVAAGEWLTNARTLEIAAILACVPQPERDNVVRGFRVFSDAAGEPGDEVWGLDLR